MTVPSLTALRLRLGAEHLVELGPRALYEFLVELGVEHGGHAAIVARLDTYRRVTPGVLAAVGGSGFPTKVFGVRA